MPGSFQLQGAHLMSAYGHGRHEHGAAVSAAPTKQAERVFPQNTQNTQNLLAEMGLPQIAQIFTD